MIEFLYYFCIAITIMVLWNFIKIFILHRHITEMIAKREQAIGEINNNLIEAEIEKHDGKYFLYEKKNKLFLAMGDDYDTLQKRLKDRFPGYAIIVSEQQLKEVGLDFGKFER